jgi:hypothetical protein
MAKQLTAADARQSLTQHVEAKGIEVYLKYGPRIGWSELHGLLADRAYVRYPCEIVFDATNLLAGECAHPVQMGPLPEDGFTMSLHPHFGDQLERAVYLVLYQLVAVNYGEFASALEAETFGAAALGLTREEYYSELCTMADELAATALSEEASDSCHEAETRSRAGEDHAGRCNCGGTEAGGGSGYHDGE